MTNSESALKQPSPPRRGRKYFTLAEAGRALALVKRIVSDIRTVNAQRLAIHAEMSADLSSRNASGLQETLQNAFNQASDRLDNLTEELAKLGVELKDRSRGLVDFPALHEGREILLCWEAGEPAIAFWHEVETGYASRRKISELAAA